MENIFKMFFSSLRVPVLKAEEDELVDPQVTLRTIVNCPSHADANKYRKTKMKKYHKSKAECSAKECAALQAKYDACNQRVNSRKNTSETCVEELNDFMECVDHCAAKTLFSKLK